MGPSGPTTVARISTGYAATLDNPPIDFGWDLDIDATVWASADAGPSIHSTGDLVSSVACGELAGLVQIDGNLLGRIDVDGKLNNQSNNAGRVQVDGDVSQADPNVPAIHIDGGVVGSGATEAVIAIGGELAGVLAIDGALQNVTTNGAEIVVGSLEPNDPDSLGAIAVDYDASGNQWADGATIQVGSNDPYTGNTPGARVYWISQCKGDLDNDEDVDSTDQTAIGLTIEDYAADYPGLLGSRWFHADLDCDDDVDADDETALDSLLTYAGCCTSACQYRACRADFNENGEVDLPDHAELISRYGQCSGDPGYVVRVDLIEDGCIGLLDLAEILGVYGHACDCFGEGDGGSEGGEDETLALFLAAYDLGSESEGYAFDLMIEVADAADDWTTAGAVVTAVNGATFRLAGTPTGVDPYATFVSPPRDPDDADADEADSGAELLGAYLPPDGVYEFSATTINVSWFDLVDSADGPAAVMRLVIEVSEVEGADVSGGFGSVYFSTSGPVDEADIQVAELSAASSTVSGADALATLSGAFYAKGE